MKLEAMIMIMISINIIMFLTQTAVINVAYDYGVVAPLFYNFEEQALSAYNVGNGTYVVTSDVSGNLPSGSLSVEPTSGNAFTDIFATVKSWFLAVPGVNYVVGVVTAVPNLLALVVSLTGLPAEIGFSIGVFWHVLAFILLLTWLFNR